MGLSVLSWKNDSQFARVEGRRLSAILPPPFSYVILSPSALLRTGSAKDLREAMSLFLDLAANRKSLRVDSSRSLS